MEAFENLLMKLLKNRRWWLGYRRFDGNNWPNIGAHLIIQSYETYTKVIETKWTNWRKDALFHRRFFIDKVIEIVVIFS